jgi:germination protein M
VFTRYLLGLSCLFLAASLGALAASCGADDPQSAGPGPSATGGTAGTTGGETAPTDSGGETATAPEGRRVSLQVWFSRPERVAANLGQILDPKLFMARREVDATEGIGTAALTELLAGPTSQETAGDLVSAVPSGTRLLGLDIAGGVATVDLSSEFESGGGSLSMEMRLAQVVYTLTQFPTVKSVRFRLDGEPLEVFSGEGIVLSKPVARKDYEELMPAILVTSPALRAEVDGPITVSGTANVFEANVTVRVVTATGKEVARTFTTATCGTGCRGDFSVTLDVPRPQGRTSAFVFVEDDDAAGVGTPPHQVRIPITLVGS